MESNEIKLCRDCKYHLRDYYLDRCTHPTAVVGINLVTGETKLELCEVNRNLDCGVEAKHFEPKILESYDRPNGIFQWLFGK